MLRLKANILPALIAAIALVVVIVVIYLLLSGFGKQSNYAPQLPKFQSTNATVPPEFSDVLNQSSQQNNQQVTNLIKNHTTPTTRFTVYYNGSVYIQPAGIVGTIATIDSPLYFTESKYGTDTKLYINATQLPLLGDGVIAYLNLTNGTISCTNFNASALSTKNYWKALLSNRSVSCIRSNSLAGINLANIAAFNLSILNELGLQMQYITEYQSTYKGVPCTYISGIITQNASNISSTGNGAFEMCDSDIYYVPLSFELYFSNNKAKVSVSQNESVIGNYSQQSYVDSVPGPILN